MSEWETPIDTELTVVNKTHSPGSHLWLLIVCDRLTHQVCVWVCQNLSMGFPGDTDMSETLSFSSYIGHDSPSLPGLSTASSTTTAAPPPTTFAFTVRQPAAPAAPANTPVQRRCHGNTAHQHTKHTHTHTVSRDTSAAALQVCQPCLKSTGWLDGWNSCGEFFQVLLDWKQL